VQLLPSFRAQLLQCSASASRTLPPLLLLQPLKMDLEGPPSFACGALIQCGACVILLQLQHKSWGRPFHAPGT
jgi:hypothetical protein